LKNDVQYVTEAAAYALGQIKPTDPKTLQALAELLKDKDWGNRANAAGALGQIKPTDPKILQALAEVLKDNDSYVRKAAIQALGEIKPTDSKTHLLLIESLKNPNLDEKERLSIQRLIQQILATPETKSYLKMAVQQKSPTDTTALCDRIDATSPDTKIDYLIELIGDINQRLK
jgi:HEAT repeat protein